MAEHCNHCGAEQKPGNRCNHTSANPLVAANERLREQRDTARAEAEKRKALMIESESRRQGTLTELLVSMTEAEKLRADLAACRHDYSAEKIWRETAEGQRDALKAKISECTTGDICTSELHEARAERNALATELTAACDHHNTEIESLRAELARAVSALESLTALATKAKGQL